MVLKQASEHFNKKTISKLDEILCVHHLGVDKKDIVKTINTNPEKIIVFKILLIMSIPKQIIIKKGDLALISGSRLLIMT